MPVNEPENACFAGDFFSTTHYRESDNADRMRHGQWPRAESVEDFLNNFLTVRKRIGDVCRDPANVKLLLVSKTVDEKHIRLAYQFGARNLPNEYFWPGINGERK